MARIASFHLVREPAWKTPLALARLGTDRLWLRRTRGLVFWRLLGTGAGDHTGSGADFSRSALFAVWEDEAALDEFLRASHIARRWQGAEESWHVRLRGVGGHGRWRGVDPLEGLTTGSATGPVAIITRAEVRRHSWKAFGVASNVVDAELNNAAGLIDVVGIGEAPVGRLNVQSVGIARSSTNICVLDARSHRGDAANPGRGLVRRRDVRPVRALRVDRHLEWSRPAREMIMMIRRTSPSVRPSSHSVIHRSNDCRGDDSTTGAATRGPHRYHHARRIARPDSSVGRATHS